MSDPLTITAAAPLIRSGDLKPTELLEQCLRRIDVYEPAVKAWAYLDRERTRLDAAKATDEIKAGNYRGPLHGIPIGIKDIIDVFDMPTGCGSKLWANSYARQDATCVERLRQAGAVILGKTVTTAYAYLDPPVTRNPWNLARTPGGSSSGSAAAVACGMCLAALGTQTGGSLIRPASYCGVCALKPTWGRVSVNGVLPLAPSLDHIGVMANCVRDLAAVYETMAGADGRVVGDTFGQKYPEQDIPDYGLFWILDRTDDVFVPHLDDEMADGFTNFLRLLTSQKPVAHRTAAVEPKRLPPGFSTIRQHHLTVMSAEAATVHRERFARLPHDYPPRIAELIDLGRGASAVQLTEALQHRERLVDDLRSPRFRFLLQPAATSPAPEADTTGNPTMNSPWSFVGVPVVSLPFGTTDDGMPLAAQIVSKRGWEDEVLRVADWCEQVVGRTVRLPPVPGVI